MVGTFRNRTACRIRNRRRRHDNNMTLRKKKTPRASQHYMGWRAGQKSLLLPVAGEFFLLTLPFIERGYRKLEVLGLTSYMELLPRGPSTFDSLSHPSRGRNHARDPTAGPSARVARRDVAEVE